MSFACFPILDPMAKSVREIAQDKSIRVQRTRDGNGDQGFSRVIAADGASRRIRWIAVAMGDCARVGFGTICTHMGRVRARIASNHYDCRFARHGSL